MFHFNIDKRSKKPFYKQIINQLENQISSGDLKHGDPLPSIEDFSTYINVSQIVIREAYRVLEQKGLIIKIVGKGTFVYSRPTIIIPFREFYDINYFFSDIHDNVKRYLEYIKIDGNETLIKTTSSIYGYPYYIQDAKVKGIYHNDLQKMLDKPDSIYEVFFKLIGSDAFQLKSYFYSRKATSFESYLLKIELHAPIFYILTTIKDQDDEDLATFETIFPSDYVSFEASI